MMMQYIMLQPSYGKLDIYFGLLYWANFISNDNLHLEPKFYLELFGCSVVLGGKKWH